MIVSVVEQAADAVLCGIVEIELVRADGVAFNTDTEDLALNSVDNIVVFLRKDLVKAVLEAKSGGKAVGGNVLEAVGDPEIVKNRL